MEGARIAGHWKLSHTDSLHNQQSQRTKNPEVDSSSEKLMPRLSEKDTEHSDVGRRIILVDVANGKSYQPPKKLKTC